MKRRDFLWTIGATTFAKATVVRATPKATLEAQATRGPSTSLRAGGTVLYDSRAVALTRVDTDASGNFDLPAGLQTLRPASLS